MKDKLTAQQMYQIARFLRDGVSVNVIAKNLNIDVDACKRVQESGIHKNCVV